MIAETELLFQQADQILKLSPFIKGMGVNPSRIGEVMARFGRADPMGVYGGIELRSSAHVPHDKAVIIMTSGEIFVMDFSTAEPAVALDV
jgi:hypothetical protein